MRVPAAPPPGYLPAGRAVNTAWLVSTSSGDHTAFRAPLPGFVPAERALLLAAILLLAQDMDCTDGAGDLCVKKKTVEILAVSILLYNSIQ